MDALQAHENWETDGELDNESQTLPFTAKVASALLPVCQHTAPLKQGREKQSKRCQGYSKG